MLKNKIGIIALILLLFLSLSIVQASDISESAVDHSQDQISSIDEDQLPVNNLVENSNEEKNSLDSLGSNSVGSSDSDKDLDSLGSNSVGSSDSDNSYDSISLSNSDINTGSDNSYDSISLCNSDTNADSVCLSNSNGNAGSIILSNSNKIHHNSRISTKIIVNNKKFYYKDKSNLNIFLKDSNNNPLKNKAIRIYLNNKSFSKVTDGFGKINLKLNLKPGKFNMKIAFAGDNDYNASSKNTVLTVKKAPLTIKMANAKSYYHSNTFFKAKVINKVTKRPVEGIKVLFKVYSSKKLYKTYYSVSNQKGIVTLNKRLKTGIYDVYAYIKDNVQKPFISYKNSKNKARLKVMNTSEMGCSSIYLHVNENESAIAFRRDSTYAADLHIVSQKWHGRYAIKQYKLTGTYFFHAITTSDGWLIGTGGWDNPSVNKRIENIAGKIVSSNTIKKSYLKSILAQERQLNTGHFAIVAPDGRYAVVWRSGYIKGKLKNGEYLVVPNARSLFRHGKYKKFSNNTAKAALKIAATDIFGVNRRNIMVYHYKRVTKDFKTSAVVKIYGANDKGTLAGRYTVGKSDNVFYKKKFISKLKLLLTPSQKYIGTHKFGNIDKLFKTQTKFSARNITGYYNQTKYFKLNLKNKKTNKALKNVRVNLRIFTGKKYKDYFVKTDKNGIAKFNINVLNVGTHKVLINAGNNKYIISGKSFITINRILNSNKNNSTLNGTVNN